MTDAASNHRKIASNIRELVVNPFGKWCEEHAARLHTSQDILQSKIKEHDKQAENVKKFRNQYYNKFRLVEDLEEEDKLAFQEPQPSSPKGKETIIPVIKVAIQEPEEEAVSVDLGDRAYTPEQLKKILLHMLENIKMGEVKVSFLGTYLNCSTGADITDYIQRDMPAPHVVAAERIGQDMVDNGFLRLIGSVGSTFANSSKMNYQWKSKAFQLAGVVEKKKPLDRVSSLGLDSDSPVSAVTEIIAGWNPLNNPYPNETSSQKLRREAKEADDKYRNAVKQLDILRSALEEAMMVHMQWMERCELDRLKAIKAVILDFSGAIGNVIPSLRSTVDKMMLFQETVQPQNDLRYLLENYRTGSFVPRVQLYENYYNKKDGT
jgi:Domain found in Dishevelled, Egl-10, and Pleckstrin (DEP)